MKKTILITIPLLMATFLFAQPATIKSIKEYTKVNGEELIIKSMMYQNINNVLPTLKQIAPNAPKSFWDKVIKNVPTNKLYESLIPVYQKYLTEEEIQVLIKFYKTPVGKKIVSIQPKVYQDSFVIGEEIGRQYGKKIMKEYKSKYGNNKL